MSVIQFRKRFCSPFWVFKIIRLKSTDLLCYSGVKLGCLHLRDGHRMRVLEESVVTERFLGKILEKSA
jgi:hypothetical protein